MVPVYVIAVLFTLIPVVVPLYWGSEIVQAISRTDGGEWRQGTSAAVFGLVELSLIGAVVVAVKRRRRRQA